MHSNVTPEGNCPALFPEIEYFSTLAVRSTDEKTVSRVKERLQNSSCYLMGLR